MRPILAILLVAGCAGRQAASPPPKRDLARYSSRELAGEKLCQHAIDNYERTEFLSTTTNVRSKALFDRTGADRRRDYRVRYCQTTLSERQAACIADARSMQYVQNCGRFPELQ